MKKKLLNFRFFSISIVWTWLFVFAFVPFVFILCASLLTHNENQLISLPFTFANFQALFQPIYLQIFIRSFYLAGICTFITLIIAYPFAYFLAKSSERYKNTLLLMVIIPFWTSSLIRTYAIMALLKAKGLINAILLSLHLIHLPLLLLYSNFAVILGLVYNLLPFMILPLFANLEKLDDRLIDAARDLGANWFTVIRKIIIPLTIPGIIAGIILVFLPAMTLFYIPDILGGAKSLLLGNLIENQFLFTNNWPMGAAISIVLTLIMALLLLIYFLKNKQMKQEFI